MHGDAFRVFWSAVTLRDEPTLDAASPSPRLAPAGDLPVGTEVGDYTIERFVGQGSCGAVYAARRWDPPALAAVKVMHAELSSSEKAVERFVREVSVVRLLRHQGIAEVYDLGKLDDGRPYYVMEYLQGEPLSALLLRHGRFSVEEAINLLGPVCAALDAAHDAGIIHRDIKASNILVSGEGAARSVKLLDFGVAKLIDGPDSATGFTTIGRPIGTLSAMAPEQILGGTVDARADVYALGILLFRLITGHHPFWSPDEVELAWRHLEEPPPRPSTRAPVTPLIDAVALRSLEKDPDRRFPSVRTFYEALCDAAGGARTRSAAGSIETTATGILVDLDIDAPDGELNDAQLDDIGKTLDFAEKTLRGNGFVIALATGSSVVGVRQVPADTTEHDARRAAYELSTSLARALAGRDGADPCVRPRIRMHVDRALLRRSATPELVGGRLADLRGWPDDLC